MKTLLVFCDFLVAAGLAWALNSLSLRPFRRVKEAHWTERARVLWPARAGAATAVWILPVDVVLGQRLLWPEEAPPWLLAALVAWLGTLAATYPSRNLPAAHAKNMAAPIDSRSDHSIYGVAGISGDCGVNATSIGLESMGTLRRLFRHPGALDARGTDLALSETSSLRGSTGQSGFAGPKSFEPTKCAVS